MGFFLLVNLGKNKLIEQMKEKKKTRMLWA